MRIHILWVLEMTQLTLTGFTMLEKRVNELEAYVEKLAEMIALLEAKS